MRISKIMNRKRWTQCIIIVFAVVSEKIFYDFTGVGIFVKRISVTQQIFLSLIVIIGISHILSFLIYHVFKFINPLFWFEEKSRSKN